MLYLFCALLFGIVRIGLLFLTKQRSLHFSCAASAAHFFERSENMKDKNITDFESKFADFIDSAIFEEIESHLMTIARAAFAAGVSSALADNKE